MKNIPQNSFREGRDSEKKKDHFPSLKSGGSIYMGQDLKMLERIFAFDSKFLSLPENACI